MARIGLLLADSKNQYQRLLGTEIERVSRSLGHELLPPLHAEGSAMTQAEQLSLVQRHSPRPDAVILMMVATDLLRPAIELLLGKGIGVVFLNRVPAYLDALRSAHPQCLVSAVTPDQQQIGTVQGEQCLALAPKGGFVLLVTGDQNTPSSRQRTAGFRSVVGQRVRIHDIEGHWSTEPAEKATADWLRLGSGRSCEVHVAVCHNDHMAIGVRQAFTSQGRQRPLLIGCDGLPSLGQHMVLTGELAATVVMPPTAQAAVEVASRFWRGQPAPAMISLPSTPLPAAEELRRHAAT